MRFHARPFQWATSADVGCVLDLVETFAICRDFVPAREGISIIASSSPGISLFADIFSAFSLESYLQSRDGCAGVGIRPPARRERTVLASAADPKLFRKKPHPASTRGAGRSPTSFPDAREDDEERRWCVAAESIGATGADTFR